MYIIGNYLFSGIRCRDEIVYLIVRLFGIEYILMNNNSKPHRANIANQSFEAETLSKLEQPLKTPDIYLIKHVWDVFLHVDAEMESCYIQYSKDNLSFTIGGATHLLTICYINYPSLIKQLAQILDMEIHSNVYYFKSFSSGQVIIYNSFFIEYVFTSQKKLQFPII